MNLNENNTNGNLIYNKSYYINNFKSNENVNCLISKLDTLQDFTVYWNFFNIKYSGNINIDENKIILKDSPPHLKHDYKKILTNFIHYENTISKTYIKKENEGLTMDYFKTIFKNDFNVSTHFKIAPILIFKNLAIIGIVFLSKYADIIIESRHKKLNKIIKLNKTISCYQRYFLIDINKTVTRLNNYNIIKGIIETDFNKINLDDNLNIVLDLNLTKSNTNHKHNNIIDIIDITYKLSYLLSILKPYYWNLRI